MHATDSFSDTFARLKIGDHEAASEVVRRYVHRLVALARSKFDPRLRARIDPDDVVQSVLGSFFQRCKTGQFELQVWEDLWSLLALITVRKCHKARVYHLRESRTVQREFNPIDGFALHDDAPGPDEEAALTEALDRVLDDFSADGQKIIQHTLQGTSAREISEELAIPERTVFRHRERFRLQLLNLLKAG